MNEESFNKPWLKGMDTTEYGPDETVGSYAAKMQLENKKKLWEKLRPTSEEELLKIKIITAPILNKIKELNKEIENVNSEIEKHKIEENIGILLNNVFKTKNPQEMSEEEIKNRISIAFSIQNSLMNLEYRPNPFTLKILDQEIDYFVEQLKKRTK